MAVWFLDVNALVALAWEERAACPRMIARMSSLDGDPVEDADGYTSLGEANA